MSTLRRQERSRLEGDGIIKRAVGPRRHRRRIVRMARSLESEVLTASPALIGFFSAVQVPTTGTASSHGNDRAVARLARTEPGPSSGWSYVVSAGVGVGHERHCWCGRRIVE